MNLEAPVSTWMTADPITTTPEASMTDLWTLMLNGGFTHAPVLTDGALVGVLSRTDVMRSVGAQDTDLLETGVILDDDRLVGDLMSRHVTTVAEGASLREAVTVLAEGRMHCLPVVRGGLVVGVITSTDVMRAVLK
jgi:CBS domain-containing protein